jgi:hypothetical protein
MIGTIEITNQLFREVRKDPNSEGRFYIEASEICIFLDFPEPSDEDWESWESISFNSLPSEVQSEWFALQDKTGA